MSAWKSHAYAVIRMLLGLLLLAAASLKAAGWVLEPFATPPLFTAPWMRLLVLDFEVILGLWLLTGFCRQASWIVVTLTFLCFSAVSAYSGWVGQASCGCFGSFTVPPWHTFTFDLAVVGILLFYRPRHIGSPRDSLALPVSPLPSAVWGIAGAVCIGGLVVGSTYLMFGSFSEALTYFRGEALTLSPSPVDLGEVRAADSRRVYVQATNRTDRAIQLIGAKFTCSCLSTDKLPLTIAPHETRLLGVVVRFGGAPGWFTQTAYWYTQDSVQGVTVMVLPIHARIVEHPSGKMASRTEGGTWK